MKKKTKKVTCCALIGLVLLACGCGSNDSTSDNYVQAESKWYDNLEDEWYSTTFFSKEGFKATIKENGDVRVQYPNSEWLLQPDLITYNGDSLPCKQIKLSDDGDALYHAEYEGKPYDCLCLNVNNELKMFELHKLKPVFFSEDKVLNHDSDESVEYSCTDDCLFFVSDTDYAKASILENSNDVKVFEYIGESETNVVSEFGTGMFVLIRSSI